MTATLQPERLEEKLGKIESPTIDPRIDIVDPSRVATCMYGVPYHATKIVEDAFAQGPLPHIFAGSLSGGDLSDKNREMFVQGSRFAYQCLLRKETRMLAYDARLRLAEFYKTEMGVRTSFDELRTLYHTNKAASRDLQKDHVLME